MVSNGAAEERPVPNYEFGQVRIRVEAAGIYHSDMLCVEAEWPGITYPRVMFNRGLR